MSAAFTIAHARKQEAGVPKKAWGLARLESILAASTRRGWEADGPRLWVRKGGDMELRIVDLTDDDGRVELDEEWDGKTLYFSCNRCSLDSQGRPRITQMRSYLCLSLESLTPSEFPSTP